MANPNPTRTSNATPVLRARDQQAPQEVSGLPAAPKALVPRRAAEGLVEVLDAIGIFGLVLDGGAEGVSRAWGFMGGVCSGGAEGVSKAQDGLKGFQAVVAGFSKWVLTGGVRHLSPNSVSTLRVREKALVPD